MNHNGFQPLVRQRKGRQLVVGHLALQYFLVTSPGVHNGLRWRPFSFGMVDDGRLLQHYDRLSLIGRRCWGRQVHVKMFVTRQGGAMHVVYVLARTGGGRALIEFLSIMFW